MSEEIQKKKVSHSQFSNWWTCPYKWYRDVILKEKTFEDNLIMSFGTAIHKTIQNYLKTLYNENNETANKIDNFEFFKLAFKKEVDTKKIPHTDTEYNEFVEDGRNILMEFIEPSNILQHFPKSKWELLAIEDELNVDILNNVTLTGFIDMVLKEKTTGNIRIIDFKTSTNAWKYQKEDFTKTSQLLIYKSLYSKKYNIPLSKIQVEFVILKRKLYENANYPQSRIQIFKPPAYQSNISQVIQKFTKFVNTCFTTDGIHKANVKYPKIPGKGKSNCKYCQYAKNKKCDQIPDIIEK